MAYHALRENEPTNRQSLLGEVPAPSDDADPASYRLQSQFSVPRKPLPSQTRQEVTQSPDKHTNHAAILKSPRRKVNSQLWETIECWWPELLASSLSIIALVAIVIVLRVYNGRSIDNLNLPRYLTLNGLIALIATFDRMFLVIPIGSALSQEAWLWFAKNEGKMFPKSRLRDLNRSDSASRGAWGSLLFLFTSPQRYEAWLRRDDLMLMRQVFVSLWCYNYTSLTCYYHIHSATCRSQEHSIEGS